MTCLYDQCSSLVREVIDRVINNLNLCEMTWLDPKPGPIDPDDDGSLDFDTTEAETAFVREVLAEMANRHVGFGQYTKPWLDVFAETIVGVGDDGGAHYTCAIVRPEFFDQVWDAYHAHRVWSSMPDDNDPVPMMVYPNIYFSIVREHRDWFYIIVGGTI